LNAPLPVLRKFVLAATVTALSNISLTFAVQQMDVLRAVIIRDRAPIGPQ
jgi:hypothetical protein